MNLDLALLQHFGDTLNNRRDISDILIRTLLRVRGKGRELLPLRVNRAQADYQRLCARHNIVLKARQMGITTFIAAQFFIRTITQPGTITVQVAHDQEAAEQIFRIVHRFWENLPRELREGTLIRSRASVHEMAFPHLDSEYRVATAGDVNAGRGTTIHNLHCSEVSRWLANGEETLASLRAAVPELGQIVLESTPNGASGVFYEEWQRAAETGYTKHFMPWWFDDAYILDKVEVEPLTDEEEHLCLLAGLTTKQIAWRRVNRAQLRGLAAQEFAEDAVSCFRASSECVFDIEAIDRALAHAGRPIEERGTWLSIWLPPHGDKQYIVGIDPAGGGTEGDYSCAQMIDRTTGMQCAEMSGHFPPQEFATRLIALGLEYNTAMLVVERNNHGHGVLAHLGSQSYPNIYSDGKQQGWLTTAASRPTMIENFAAVLSANPELFRSVALLNECRTFVRHKDGTSGAAQGAHDDRVMAMAIALASRRQVAGKIPPPISLITLTGFNVLSS